ALWSLRRGMSRARQCKSPSTLWHSLLRSVRKSTANPLANELIKQRRGFLCRSHPEDFMRPQPLICVTDVEASSRWYQRLLGCRSAHGGAEYERLVSNGRLVLQLHRWDVVHDHGPIGDQNLAHGNGVLLWFELDD